MHTKFMHSFSLMVLLKEIVYFTIFIYLEYVYNSASLSKISLAVWSGDTINCADKIVDIILINVVPLSLRWVQAHSTHFFGLKIYEKSLAKPS